MSTSSSLSQTGVAQLILSLSVSNKTCLIPSRSFLLRPTGQRSHLYCCCRRCRCYRSSSEKCHKRVRVTPIRAKPIRLACQSQSLISYLNCQSDFVRRLLSPNIWARVSLLLLLYFRLRGKSHTLVGRAKVHLRLFFHFIRSFSIDLGLGE